MGNSTPIMKEVFSYFASDPIGPMLNLERVAEESENPISSKITEQLALFDTSTIDRVKEDKQFRFFCGPSEGADLDRKARLWALKQLLIEGIPEARLRALIDSCGMKRPPPYEHSAVANLQLDPDCMVPLSSFRVRAGALMREETGFTVLLPIESTNSQYWLIQSLLQEGLQAVTAVRLDPFIVQPEKDYPCIEYRMWWYGVPLDWERIDNLNTEEHGRWAPGKLSTQSAYTDYAWTPRAGEVHFRYEELPLRENVRTRGSRYFHAIYSPARKKIVHLDGAIRIYDPGEWDSRQASHVRKSGKIGKRIKVFKVDTEVSRDSLGAVCSNFFVWNYDVARYFGAEIPKDF
jgi:hypothetical protein